MSALTLERRSVRGRARRRGRTLEQEEPLVAVRADVAEHGRLLQVVRVGSESAAREEKGEGQAARPSRDATWGEDSVTYSLQEGMTGSVVALMRAREEEGRTSCRGRRAC